MPNLLTRLLGDRPPMPEAKSAQMLMAIRDLGAPDWTRRNFSALAQEGFMRNPVVHRCVRMIAETANRVPMVAVEDGRRLSDHPLLTLLRRPNPHQSGSELLEGVYAYLQTAGNAYLHAALSDGEVRGLYMPLADRRVGPGPYETAELADSIAGGEGFDWYYASDAARTAATRTAITDGAYGEPWVWRFKDLASWWNEPHHDRPGGVRSSSATAWVPRSKKIWFTELGCGAIDRGANQPNVFLDPKSAESFAPYFSNGAPDALMQRQFLRAVLGHWAGSGMVERITLWTWDARPYPAFPQLADVWADGSNHATGHWLTGRLGAMASDEVLRALATDYGVGFDRIEAAPPFVHGYVIEAPMTLRQAMEPVLAMSGLAVRDGVGGLSIGRAASELAEIGEAVADGGPLLTRRRPDAGETVGRVGLGYLDRERNYLMGSVTAIADATGAMENVAAGLVLDIGGARHAAERVLSERNAQRETVELTLLPSQVAFEISDAIAVGGEAFEIVEIRDGQARRVTARAIPPERDVAVIGERPSRPSEVPAARALPVVMAAHLPSPADDLAHSRLAIGGFARPWPGEIGVTDEGSGTVLATLARRATLGMLAAPFAAGTMFGWDMAQSLLVELHSGHLSSRDDLEILAGANRIAIENDAGGWEIVGFANAELVAPGTYRLTRLLRGQGGSDHAIGSASSGRRAMLLDGYVASSPVDPAWLGAVVQLRCFAGTADAVGVVAAANIDLAPILPLRPVHLRAGASGGDIALGWVRRSRADTDSWATADAPLDFAPEAYRVEIRSGLTLLRTISVTAPTAIYSAAQQVTDFGGPATSFGFRVAQMSALYGPGHWAQGEFNA